MSQQDHTSPNQGLFAGRRVAVVQPESLNLAQLVGTLYGALIVFVLVALVPVALLFRIPNRRFWRYTKEPWLIAFSTASIGVTARSLM